MGEPFAEMIGMKFGQAAPAVDTGNLFQQPARDAAPIEPIHRAGDLRSKAIDPIDVSQEKMPQGPDSARVKGLQELGF